MSVSELSIVVYVVVFIITTTGTTFDNLLSVLPFYYDDNRDNFLTTFSCLSAQRGARGIVFEKHEIFCKITIFAILIRDNRHF